MDGEDRRAVLAAIAKLPQRQREVLALKYYLDLSEHDVAAILRVSVLPEHAAASWPPAWDAITASTTEGRNGQADAGNFPV
jgi:hypothetical protein